MTDALPGRWKYLFRRLSQLAERNAGHGVSVVSLRLVLVDGELRHWGKPFCRAWEPDHDTTLLDLICQDDDPPA